MRKLTICITFLIILSVSAYAQTALKVGQSISNLALLGTNGRTFSLNDQKNAKGFILIFMTPTCDHCIAYEPRVMALDKKYKPKGFPIVAIGPYGDDPIRYPLDAMPEMKKLAERKGFTFPYLSDVAFKYTWLFGIKTTPTAVVLQKNAKGYQIKYIGPIDDEQNPKKVPTKKYVELEINKLIK